MRFGLPISIALHLAILLWATISIGSAKPPVVPDEIPIEISLLTTADLANLRKGSETAKTKTSAAQPKEADSAEAPAVKAKRVAPAPPKTEPEPAKPEPPKPEPPKPEPPKPEPPKVAPPKPEPPVESKTAPAPKSDPITEQLAKADPLPEPKKPEPPKTEPKAPDPIAQQLAKTSAVDPPVKKEPPKKAAPKPEPVAPAAVKAPKKQKGLDIAKLQAQISQLPDAAPDAGSDLAPDPTAVTKAPAVGIKKPSGTQLSATEQQMFLGIFKQKVQGCWTILAGASDARDLIVPVSFDLSPDGRLIAEPVVTGSSGSPQFALAAENVVSAIRQCEPYALPPDLYAKWQHWDINFDPRAMFGG